MSCCGGFIGSLWDGAVDAVEDVGGAITGGLESVGEAATDAIETVSDNPALLAAIALSIVAPGAGTLLGEAIGLSGTTATFVGNAAINTALNGGDVEAGIMSAALPIVGGEIASAAASQFVDAGLSEALANTAGKITAQAGLSAITGKGDPLSILISGGVSAGTDAVLNQIEGFDALPAPVQQAVKSAVTSSLTGSGDPTQAAIDAAINTGLSTLGKYVKSDALVQTDPETGRRETDQSGALLEDPFGTSQIENSGNIQDAVKLLGYGESADIGSPLEFDEFGNPKSQTGTTQDILGAINSADTTTSTAIDGALSGLSSAEVGQGEVNAIDAATNIGDISGLSSAEVGQGEQAAIDTENNIGNLEGLSSPEVGQGEQAAIETIPQDQALADLTAAEEANPITEPETKTPNVSVGSGLTTGTGALPSTKTTTNQISSAPVASGLAAVGIPWLDTSADVLQGKNVQGNNDPFAGIDPCLAEVLRQRGLIPQAQHQPTSLMASGGSTSCQTLDDKLMPKFAPSDPEMLQTVASSKRTPLSMKPLRHMQQAISPLGSMGGLAAGGLPKKYQEAAPKGHNTEFVTGLTGYYADGRGTGQSDDIPAMLHDGDYVMDAETVSALGDGSSKAGRQVLDGFRTQIPHSAKSGGSVVPAKIADGEYVFPESFVTALGQGDNKHGASILDGLREKLREHKRSAPLNKIPPKAKSPLDYIKTAKG